MVSGSVPGPLWPRECASRVPNWGFHMESPFIKVSRQEKNVKRVDQQYM